MKLACQENLVPGKSLEEKLYRLEKYGYAGIEFWGGNIKSRAEEIRRLCEQSKVKPSTICAGFRGSPLDADKGQRDLAMADIKELLEVAGYIGAIGVIVVPIFGQPKVPDLSPWKTAREIEFELLVKLLKDIAPHAERANSILLIEPLNRYETHFLRKLEDAVSVVKEVASPNIQIMADFFHMSIEEVNIVKSIEAAGQYIQHIHLADSTRLLPGYGHTDFEAGFAALKKIGFRNYMALECVVPGDPDLELPKCAEYLRKFI